MSDQLQSQPSSSDVHGGFSYGNRVMLLIWGCGMLFSAWGKYDSDSRTMNAISRQDGLQRQIDKINADRAERDARPK